MRVHGWVCVGSRHVALGEPCRPDAHVHARDDRDLWRRAMPHMCMLLPVHTCTCADHMAAYLDCTWLFVGSLCIAFETQASHTEVTATSTFVLSLMSVSQGERLVHR